jgi:HK97 gp10 family phage protein
MIVASFPGLMEQAVSKTAKDIEATAKSICPYDTGALQESILSESEGLKATISPSMDYAGYVEFGTYKMSAQPYMRPAADMHEAAFVAFCGKVVDSLMG